MSQARSSPRIGVTWYTDKQIDKQASRQTDTVATWRGWADKRDGDPPPHKCDIAPAITHPRGQISLN